MLLPTPVVKAATLAVVVLVSLSCARRTEGASQGRPAPRPSGVGYYMKKVVAKESPDMLIANDATVCRVPASQFRAVMTGTSIRCNWQ